jgi:hypothetical protein
MSTQPRAAPAARRVACHRQISLAHVPRRDAAQRLSLAFGLLARAASTASQPAARPATLPPAGPVIPITEVLP